MSQSNKGLYIALISVHGLIRGKNLELGRDSDTGGQTKYVVDLALALGRHPDVARVDLVTRKIVDEHVDSQYAADVEPLGECSQIVRIECGPEKYLPKEELWDYIDIFSDNLLDYFFHQEAMPDVIHAHYADAGYVASRIGHATGLPIVFTGHSLGRDKRKRLIASGMTSKAVDEKYNIIRRIEAEETILASADLVITSTNQEIRDQYELYDFYKPESMTVIPPGTRLEEFHPPELGEPRSQISHSIKRFLDEPDKPMILALSRPDQRKNIATLVKAFGESEELKSAANLVVVAGNRDDVREMDDNAQDVFTELFVLIDYYDLYGKVAIPKKHQSHEVSHIYRMAAISMGVFVNPALTEPFGLTLLESAASGLPFVATENGGPVDIVNNLDAGILVDPLNPEEMGDALKALLFNADNWRMHSRNGLNNIEANYSWRAHVNTYLGRIESLTAGQKNIAPDIASLSKSSRKVSRLIITDLDKTLLSDTKGLKQFSDMIRENRRNTAFGIATARRLDSTLNTLKQHGLPTPDIIITSLGTEIHYSQSLNKSSHWAMHVDHNWNPKTIRRVLSELAYLELQDEKDQSRYKLSYQLKAATDKTLCKEEIVSLLRKEEQSVNVFVSNGSHLDITPIRASKGLALRYVAHAWDIPLENILVSGGAGSDEDMMSGNTLAVIVNNRVHEPLEFVHEDKQIYYAEKSNAYGILEAIDHYQFFDREMIES